MSLEKKFNKSEIKKVSKEEREIIASTIDDLMCRYLGFSNNPEVLKELYPGKECYVGPFADKDGSFGIKLLYLRSRPEEMPHRVMDFFVEKMLETELGVHMVSGQRYLDEGHEIRCTTNSSVAQTIEALRNVTEDYKQETSVEAVKDVVRLSDRYLSDIFKKLTPDELEKAVAAIKKNFVEQGIIFKKHDNVKPESKALIDSKQNKIQSRTKF